MKLYCVGLYLLLATVLSFANVAIVSAQSRSETLLVVTELGPNSMADLRDKFGIAYLFVPHDLNLVRLMSDRLLVMYLGKIVEAGDSETIFRAPRHPYTRALISAIPVIEPNPHKQRIRLVGESRSPIDPPPDMCRFYGRCPDGYQRCAGEMPELKAITAAHQAACHLLHAEAATEPVQQIQEAM